MVLKKCIILYLQDFKYIFIFIFVWKKFHLSYNPQNIVNVSKTNAFEKVFLLNFAYQLQNIILDH